MSSSARSLRPGGGKPWRGLASPLADQEDLGVLALQPEVTRETSPWQLLKEERNKNKVLQVTDWLLSSLLTLVFVTAGEREAEEVPGDIPEVPGDKVRRAGGQEQAAQQADGGWD